MPNIDLSILNQRQTPAFYADVFANRPAAGFVGRIFVSTDTFAFYRDNGTGWDLIGGPGTGTVTGTGANGQVTFWNGASTITGSNDLFWDATNGHLGVNTNAPGTALDVHHDQPTVAILNQTVATNDVRLGFQNNGVGLWRIGAFYNAGANDFGIFDAVAAIQPVTVKKTTGQVLIGTSTVGAGKLVVASASSDNGVQIVGASAPSLRIDNAETGATKRAGLGISTAINNFIQGSADRDFCIFNGSTAAASPILFGVYDAGAVNVQEAARISPARNFLIGTTTDSGEKLQVNGTGYINGLLTVNNADIYSQNGTGTNLSIGFKQSSAVKFRLRYDIAGDTVSMVGSSGNFIQTWNQSGLVGIGTTNPSSNLSVRNEGTSGISIIDVRGGVSGAGVVQISGNGTTLGSTSFDLIQNSAGALIIQRDNNPLSFYTNATERMRINASGNLGLGVTPSAWASGYTALQIENTGLMADADKIWMYANGYFDGSANRYMQNGFASRYYQANSSHVWETAASGTAGNAISFTQAMTLASTGNLLIGTTTDAGDKLQVNGAIKTASPSGGTAGSWKLGTATSGAAVQGGTVRIEINGVAYDLLTT